MKKPAASGQFLAYQLKQSFRKPRILLWMMSRVSLPLPSQHRPLPTAITFLLGGRLRNPCGSSREEMIFPAQSRWAPSSAPTASGSGVGGTSEAMLMGTVARGWVSSAEILTCFCQPGPQSHLHSLILRGLWRARRPLLSLLFEDGGPCSGLGLALLPGTVCRQGAGANRLFQPGWTGAVCRWFQG